MSADRHTYTHRVNEISIRVCARYIKIVCGKRQSFLLNSQEKNTDTWCLCRERSRTYWLHWSQVCIQIFKKEKEKKTNSMRTNFCVPSAKSTNAAGKNDFQCKCNSDTFAGHIRMKACIRSLAFRREIPHNIYGKWIWIHADEHTAANSENLFSRSLHSHNNKLFEIIYGRVTTRYLAIIRRKAHRSERTKFMRFNIKFKISCRPIFFPSSFLHFSIDLSIAIHWRWI